MPLSRGLLGSRLNYLLLLLGCLFHLLFQLFDACFDPWVSEGVLRRHALIRFPLEALVNEVDEVVLVLVRLHQLRQVLAVYLPHLSL